MAKDIKNALMGDDDRLVATDDIRVNRDSEDIQRALEDGTAMSAEERRRLLRNEWSQEALPSAPPIPGYHLCWLATNSSYDPIVKRIRMGYQPVKTSELPGFENYKMKSGDFEGCVSCNEMVLFKLPDAIYQEIMTEFHYTMPLEEEQRIKSNLEQAGAGSEKSQMEEGFVDLARPVRRPVFS